MEKDNIKKGCVYFFKHTNLTPIKIGYSDNQSPFDRFTQFKTYAPFGAEIIGFIICENPIELEKKLHEKYKSYRLDGEWFDLDIEIVNEELEFLTTKNQKDEFNDLVLKYASLKNEKINSVNVNFSKNETDVHTKEIILNINELLSFCSKCSKKQLIDKLIELNITYKLYRISKNNVKKGCKVWIHE